MIIGSPKKIPNSEITIKARSDFMVWRKLIEEVGKKEFGFLEVKARNKVLNTFITPIRISDSLNPVIITSSPRSGSTWLLELILESARYRVIFEPLPEISECLSLYQTPRLILNRNSLHSWLSDYMRKLTQTNELIRRQWRNSAINSRNIHLFTKGVVIKLIRANFCIDYIDKNLPDERLKILILVRNPLAVIKSRITKVGRNLAGELSYDPTSLFNTNDTEFTQYFNKYKSTVSSLASQIEKEAFVWCIENKWILDLVDKRRWKLIIYENLYVDFIDEFMKICNYIGIPYKNKVEKSRYRKSTTSFSGVKRQFIDSSIIKDKELFLNDWREFYNKEEIRKVMEIFDMFEIYYNSFLNEKARKFLELP